MCGGHPRGQAGPPVREARRRRMFSAKPEEMGGRLLHLGAASPSRDARRLRQEDGLAESRMATAALSVTGSDAGGDRDVWSDMGRALRQAVGGACAGRWTLRRASRTQRRKGAACGAAPPCF